MKISDYISEVDSLDPITYFKFLENAVKGSMRVFVLGKTHGKPIFLLTPEKIKKKLPNVLFCAGFHGEEIAGCWAILRFIEEYYSYYKDYANISFMPVANPIGFLNFKRNDKESKSPNTFLHEKNIAIETKIILKNLDTILKLGKNCIVSLHEDADEMYCYCYGYERRNKPGKFSYVIRKALTDFLPLIKDQNVNVTKDLQGNILKIRKGIIFRFHDGSFEDLLFRKGIPYVGVSETPVKANFELRIEGAMNVIKSTIEFITGTEIMNFEGSRHMRMQ